MRYTSRIILDNKLGMLRGQVYRDRHNIVNWQTRQAHYVEPVRFEFDDPQWKEIHLGDHWQVALNQTRFFRTDVQIPESFGEQQAYLVLEMGGEAQVRINGEIVSGVTSYQGENYLTPHTRSRVRVPKKYRSGDVISVEVEACMNFLESYCKWVPGGAKEYTIDTAFIATADEALESYCFDLQCAMEAMDSFANPLDEFQNSNAPIRSSMVCKVMDRLQDGSFYQKKIHAAICESLKYLDLEFDYERLKASIPEAARVLHEQLDLIPSNANGTLKLVGQAHIDTAWLWPLKESVRKCGKTFSNVLDLMDRYPDLTFAFSQPQLFAYLEEYYPEVFAKVQERVKEGRIELVGNAWVEMDTNVPSGESLVRQLLYGRQYYLEKFGQESKVFWMPDVFGYSWAMPQIIRRSGVEYFFTAKLGNNDTNRFPHSLFRWQGTDGTRLLAYLLPMGYNGEVEAEYLHRAHRIFHQKDLCDTTLVTVGYGDGGGGPSYQMAEKLQRFKNMPGLPRAEFSTSLSFFEEARKAEEELPVWNDEMYYEFHRGTYTSQADVKKNNRKGELLLRQAEIACSMAHVLLGREYPAREIGNVWKKLLTNQFHDILPGSSIHQVYEDCAAIYAQVMQEAGDILKAAMKTLNGALGLEKNQAAVWNFLGWEHSAQTQIALEGSWTALVDENGVKAASSVEEKDGKNYFRFEACGVPAMGVKIYSAVCEESETAAMQGSVSLMENEFLKVCLDENGNLASVFDKKAQREVLEAGKVSNLLTIFEDIPHRESAWNIDLEYMNRFWNLEKAESVELVEKSAVRTVVRVVRRFNLSTITQDIILEKNARRIDFVTHVDWWETEKMLKAAFYADILSSKATYEIQFGSIERPTHWNTSYDIARFEVCGHKWADLSEGLYGVSILNDCKYGYDIKDNCMRLTLLRSPNYPDETGDKGVHDFTYSLYPHSGDWRVGETVREAFELNVPLASCSAEAGEKALSAFSLAQVSASHVVLDSIKGAEDGCGLILRLYESQGARGKVKVQLGFEAAKVTECNLMEVDEKDVETDGQSFCFDIRPYEVRTFRVEKKN